MKKIGNVLATLRKEKGITQEEIAQKLRVDRSTISKWETEAHMINAYTLIEYLRVLDVSALEFENEME